MELRDLMATLRYLARQSSVSRLRTAEMRINEYVWPLRGADRASGIESLRDAIRAEADIDDEGEFWDTLEEYVSTLT